VLNSQPTADVTIGLSSSDTTEGTVSPASVTFTTANWNTTQTVTVTGVDDAIMDGNVAYTIITAPATSGDSNYNNLNAADVSVTNNDDDTAGITVTPTSGLVTTEAGGTDTFTIVLNTEPTASVSIGLSSSDTGEGTVSPSSVTFTTANWNTTQTVTVTGVNDAIDDGDIPYTIVTAAATGGDYAGIDAADVSVTNDDNDTKGITVGAISGHTTEAGGTATFTIVLNSQPTASVNIGLTSSDTGEGTVSPASVTFTTANWNTPQTVTVTGVNDDEMDGDIPYTIVTAAATGGDYAGIDAADVSVTNDDDDTAGITVTPTAGLVTTEAGGTATFTIVLDSQPTADVSIGLSSSDTGEGTVSPASVTFTTANWNTPQTVTVTGVDDFVADGNVGYTIVTAAATSTDGKYSGMDASDVSLTNSDNEIAGITVSAISGPTTEAGGTATFTIVLNTQPTANVSIGLSSSDTGEGTVSPASITFTTANWNTAQTVTVTGVDDLVVDGNVAYTIVTAAATGGDYAGIDAADVSVTNNDNDVAVVAAPIEWWILVIQSTEGGRVTEPIRGNFPYGAGDFFSYYPDTVVDLVAVPDAGYRFAGWTGGPGIIADVSAATTTITMIRDCAIMANFAEIPETPEIVQYSLTTSSTSGGSVTVPGEGTFTYDAGRVLDLVATADSGYRFVNWTGDVTTIANVNGASTTITMNDDYSVVANFAEIPRPRVTLTVSSTDGGSVTNPGEATFAYDEGTVVDLEAEPEEGYRFVIWIGDVDDIADVTAASTTITMNDDYFIIATFKFGTGCFIATAAYGTPMADEIQILREFRDEYMLTNPVGSTLVDIYYRVSPPIAEFITEHPSLKPIVRAGLVPAVAMSTVAVSTTPAEKAAILGLSVLISVALAIWVTRRRAKSPQYV